MIFLQNEYVYKTLRTKMVLFRSLTKMGLGSPVFPILHKISMEFFCDNNKTLPLVDDTSLHGQVF